MISVWIITSYVEILISMKDLRVMLLIIFSTLVDRWNPPNCKSSSREYRWSDPPPYINQIGYIAGHAFHWLECSPPLPLDIAVVNHISTQHPIITAVIHHHNVLDGYAISDSEADDW